MGRLARQPRRRSPRRTSTSLVVALVLVGLAAAGCGSGSGTSDSATTVAAHAGAGIRVTNARIPAPANPDTAAVYLTITNGTDHDVVLESVTTTAGGHAEVHRSSDENGMATMAPAGPMTVDAGATLVLEPGGYHVMVMNPTRSLQVGDHVSVTLHFRGAQKVVTTARVVAPSDVVAGGDGHGDAESDDAHGH